VWLCFSGLSVCQCSCRLDTCLSTGYVFLHVQLYLYSPWPGMLHVCFSACRLRCRASLREFSVMRTGRSCAFWGVFLCASAHFSTHGRVCLLCVRLRFCASHLSFRQCPAVFVCVRFFVRVCPALCSSLSGSVFVFVRLCVRFCPAMCSCCVRVCLCHTCTDVRTSGLSSVHV